MSDETTLLPCPFCGGEAEVTSNGRGQFTAGVRCRDVTGCGCRLHIAFRSRAEAIAAWNTRAELGSGTCELHDCEGSFSPVNRPVWRCDCGAFMTQYTDATTYHKPRFCPNCGKAVGR